MTDKADNDKTSSNVQAIPSSHPPMMRSNSTPNTPTSPLASNPWYRQKFEQYRDAIEEKVREEYPDLPKQHRLQPANIEHSTVKGYDLDFPVELHDGQSTVVSIAYGSGGRPAYTKGERHKLISVRQNTIDRC